MPASGFNLTNAYEFFIVLGEQSLKSNNTYTKNIISTSVYSNMPKIHKAVMKPEVCEWFIENFTKENDYIIDSFGGLGTTAIECLKHNRRFCYIEKEKAYCKEAYKRIKQYL